MKTSNTLAVLPLIRKARANKLGEVPIYFRITVNGETVEFSTKHYIKPDLWDSKAGRVSGRSALSKSINDDLNDLELSCRKHYNHLLTTERQITAYMIKNLLQGKDTRAKHTLISVFTKLVDDTKALVGRDYSESTLNHYKATLSHLKRYVISAYNSEDIALQELNFEFIAGFEIYLKTNGGCAQNGTIKHIQRLRKAITKALHHEYLDKDPFLRYSIKKKKTLVQPLNKYELQAIEEKEFGIERLNTIRDLFLFTCYTGLAFSDAALLKQENIRKGIDGEDWIFIFRKKTGEPSRIPLLPPAKALINKLKDHPKVQGSDKLLPVPSNQKFNAYLKEIADLCGITKKLTVHIGRHTFATTVALQNGIPMDVVKEILGHGNITTTQIYAKVSDERIATAIQILRDKY